MSNDSDNTKSIENPKRIPITSSKSKSKNIQNGPNNSTSENMPIRRKLPEDDFKISPFLVAGLAIAAFGFGGLIDPNVTDISSTAFESWSIIIIGLIIAVPGVYTMVRDHFRNKKK